MTDDFDLGPASAAPLPMSPMGQAQPAKDKKKQWLRLAMIMAAASKGGPGAVEGVLQGIQRSDLLGQQQQNQQAQQARLANQDALDAQNRQSVLADRELQRKQDFLTKFQGGLGTLDDEAAVNAYVQLHQGQAPAFGVDPAALGTYAATAMPASKLQKKAAESYVGKLKATYGEKWLEQAAQFGTHTVKGEQLTLAEVLQRAELPGVPQPVPVVPKPDVPNTPEEQFYQQFAVENGAKTFSELPTVKQAAARKQWMQADDVEKAPKTPGPSQLTPTARANVIGSRRNQWTRFSKAVTERQSAIQKVDSGVQALERGNRNAATQAIIIGFNKLLDETSVVREGEYARTEQLVPLVSRIEGAIQRVTMGGASMTDADLRALASEAKSIAQSLEGISQAAAANLRQGIEEELADYGIPPSRVFGSSTIGVRKPAMPSEQAAPPANRPRIKSVTKVNK